MTKDKRIGRPICVTQTQGQKIVAWEVLQRVTRRSRTAIGRGYDFPDRIFSLVAVSHLNILFFVVCRRWSDLVVIFDDARFSSIERPEAVLLTIIGKMYTLDYHRPVCKRHCHLIIGVGEHSSKVRLLTS
jgi:hypothetical protein